MSFENGKGRKPDYRVGVKTKQGAGKSGQGTIGAAWKEDDGTISIVLNPCVVLRFEDDVVIRLFPNDYVPRARREPTKVGYEDVSVTDDDNPPF